MNNFMSMFSILELMDGDWSHPDNLPPTEDPDPPWAKETWVNKEDHITEPPILLFTDIFKEKALPKEVLDEMKGNFHYHPIKDETFYVPEIPPNEVIEERLLGGSAFWILSIWTSIVGSLVVGWWFYLNWIN